MLLSQAFEECDDPLSRGIAEGHTVQHSDDLIMTTSSSQAMFLSSFIAILAG